MLHYSCSPLNKWELTVTYDMHYGSTSTACNCPVLHFKGRLKT